MSTQSGSLWLSNRDRENSGPSKRPPVAAMAEPAARGMLVLARRGSTSPEEEPESPVSTTSDEEDPLMGEPRGHQLCRRIVRSSYRGKWASLAFDLTGPTVSMWRKMRQRGNFVRLTTAQTEKWSDSSWTAPTTPS